jgi:hypothetical protein
MSNSDQKNEIDYEAINILLMSYDLNPYIGLNDNDYKRLIVVIDNIDNLKAEYKNR